MEIPVLIEPVAGTGYRAKSGGPLVLTAEGPTGDEAVQNLEQLISRHLAGGSRFVSIHVPDTTNPWLDIAGTYDPDDAEVVAWHHAMADYREEVDIDPDYR